MSNSDDLMYSSEGSAARYMLYRDINDINIFVEDEHKEYEYETIFQRLLGNEYCIGAIFAVGGKPTMKLRYEEFGSKNNIYIVDGDFDRYIHYDEMVRDDCFIYLKAYNIENYFIDEKACEKFSKGLLKCLDANVKTKISFSSWRTLIVEQAKKLFLCYCFLQKYYPEKKTLSRSSFEFIDQKNGFERKDGAYKKFFQQVLNLDPQAEEKIATIKASYEEINGEDYFNLICGKFLIDSLHCHIEKVTHKVFSKEALRWSLINDFDISKLDYIKKKILKANCQAKCNTFEK